MLADMISLTVDGPLATCTLSRPPVNAIDEEWLARLDAVLAELERAREVAALHIRSSERAFCAGADLALMGAHMGSPDGRTHFVAFVREIQRVFARLERLPQVTLAEIGTNALGGGLELALACDLRIAAEGARIGLPETGLGLLPGAGGTQRLARIAGQAMAKRLILGAEVLSGTQAAALGIVHWAVQANDLAERARTIAHRIASMPPDAVAAAKRCIDATVVPEAPGYEMELEATARLLGQDGTQRRVRAFLAKRR
ncbi:MAG TPA: enoyl-CoA hydratase/isomerase family protein [Burkholderiales bacterium]|nr:enoyl-CoA hydratase/isomerase family protein [Burkholderiales bacterium]